MKTRNQDKHIIVDALSHGKKDLTTIPWSHGSPASNPGTASPRKVYFQLEKLVEKSFNIQTMFSLGKHPTTMRLQVASVINIINMAPLYVKIFFSLEYCLLFWRLKYYVFGYTYFL